MHNILKTLLITVSLVITFGFLAGTAEAQKAPKDAKIAGVKVDCADPKQLIQSAVNNATGPTTIFISGTCFEDVSITKDDITLSGNEAGDTCNKADPGGTGTIDGTVTVDGVRATIEFLTITGSGAGVDIIDRATARLVCNDISLNEAHGVSVLRSSNAVLRDNTLSGNGTRTDDFSIHWDCGLFAVHVSSVFSLGNTYADNQFCAIEIDSQSSFKNGVGMIFEPGHPVDPAKRDVFTERGCNPGNPGNPNVEGGCFTTDGGPIAISVYNGGLVDLRNADVNGEIDTGIQSSLRIDGDTDVQGNININISSVVRIKNRKSFLGDHEVTYSGTLDCDVTSQAWGGDVQCGQKCFGPIPGSCVPSPP